MLKKLLITGASGGLGRMLRGRLGGIAESVRLSDIVPPAPAGDGEEIVVCDLGDRDAVDRLVAGCDGIVHLGGVSVEDCYEKIRNANIDGVFHLYEAVRRHGSPRVLFASSNHVVGFHRQDSYLDDSARQLPDGLYGVSKCYGEAMANLYHHKFGVESAIVRIGSCFPEPADHRMLSTWLSYDDFVALVKRVFEAPRLGCPIIYGASANDAGWWDNGNASYLGWKAKDSADVFREAVESRVERPSPDAAAAVYQGGKFTEDPIYDAPRTK